MLTTVILTKNEEKMIQACINSVKSISSEIIAVENDSTDNTVEILKQNNCKIIFSSDTSFGKRRELGATAASGDWILYLDADERVTPELASEITKTISSNPTDTGFILNRQDYYFGRVRPTYSPMHRLFKRSALKGWEGEVHETPILEGSVGQLKAPLIHLTHIDIDSMLHNTLNWSTKEAELRFNHQHLPIVWWRLIRVMLTAFWESFVKQQGYKCGTEGWIEALYQASSMFLTYAKLWELQNKKKIERSYQEIDQKFK